MFAGPIFRVEMVSAARRGRYYLLRVLYGLIILFVLWTTYQSTRSLSGAGGDRALISQTALTAATFFWSFSWVQLLGLLAVGPAMAVGTIASERERRTIEYLFATDLSNLEIVLGKTIARLSLIGSFAAVSVPILYLFRLLGGIPASLVGACFLITGSTALYITAISVTISVWSKRSRDASIRVYLALAALLILPAILAPVLSWSLRGSGYEPFVLPVLEFLNGLNPVLTLGNSMQGALFGGAGITMQPILIMAGWHTAISLTLIAIATTAVRRVHLREISRGESTKRTRFRLPQLPMWRPALRNNPMLWKEAFAATAKTKWGIIGALAAAAIGMTALGFVIFAFWMAMFEYRYSNYRDYFEFLGVFSGMVGSGLLLLIAARASGLITAEKERDCWTALLSTPLTGGEIIAGKALGNLYALRWGFFLLLLAWALGMAFQPWFVVIVCLQAVVLTLCAWFVTNVGLLFSLKSKTSLRAMGFTLFLTVFVGGGYLFCCCPIAAIAADDDWMMIGFAPCMPFLLMFSPLAAGNEFGSNMSEFVTAFATGIAGYLFANVMLTGYMASEFESLAGRTDGSPGRR